MRKLSGLVNDEEDPFGPGTDLIIALVAFLLLVLIVAAVTYKQKDNEISAAQQAIKNIKGEIARDTGRFNDLKNENDDLKGQIAAKDKQIDELQRTVPAPPVPAQNFPPNILIEEAQGKFISGSAKLTTSLKDYIRSTVVPQIERTSEDQKFGIDTIMVIGHTDGRPLGNKNSTLDEAATKGTELQMSGDHTKAGSNVDLGMMRALAVVSELRRFQQEEGRLKLINAKTGFRAYSAGPFLTPEGTWAAPEKKG